MGRKNAKGQPEAQRKNRSVAVVGGLVAVALIGLAIWKISSGDPTEDTPGEGGTAKFESIEYSPAQPVPPSALRPPASLSPQQRSAAQQGIVLYGNALAALQSGDVPRFIGTARQALSSFSQSTWMPRELDPFHNLFLNACQEAGDLRTAIVVGSEWLERYPDSLDHLETVGKAEYRAGRFAQAVERLENYVAKRPKSLRTWRQLAAACQALGQKEKGLDAVEKMLGLIAYPNGSYANHPEGLTTLLVALQVTHRFYDYERLAPLARAALELDPKSNDARMALGVAERQLGNHVEAKMHLRAYLDAAKGSDSYSENAELVLLELALAQLKEGDVEAAFSSLVDLLIEDPDATKAYFQLGQCFARLGLPKRAEAYFERSRELAPADREDRREVELRGTGNRAGTERARAESLRLRGLYAEGARVLRDALKQSGGSPQVHVNLIEYLYKTGQVSAAKREIAEFRKKVGDQQSDVLGWTALVLGAEGDTRQAGHRFSMLLGKKRQHVEIWAIRFARDILEGIDDSATLKKWMTALLASGPQAEATILLARAEWLGGNHARAIDLLASQSREDDEWEWRQGDLILAGARIARGADGDARASLLALERFAETRPVGARPAEFWNTLAQALAKGADVERARPLLGVGTTSSASATLISKAQTLGAEAKARHERHRNARHRAAKTSGIESARARVEIGTDLARLGDRANALHELYAARASAPESPEVLRALLSALDGPADTFLRHRVDRQLAKIDNTFRAPSREELVRELRAKIAEN